MPTRALRSAASGLLAQQINIETISNNIANVNTTAFKKNRAEFQDLMYQEVNINPIASDSISNKDTSSERIQVGNGVMPSSTQKIFKQGDLTPTQNELDLGIQGEGFFQLRKPDGTFVYTRDGSFKVNADGEICTSNGLVLEPGLKLDDNALSVSISKDGTVEVKETNGTTLTLGTIELARFVNPGGLTALGDNLYGETQASGTPMLSAPGKDGFGEVNQGFLEASNVDIVEEMISMITAQRAYEINSKTVKTVEDMLTTANNLKR
jgi:flagellar basal-body rod protein FlgG